MRNGGALTRRVVGGFNTGVVKLRSSRRWGRFVSRHLTVVTYTGRRSGRSFSTTVAYRRSAEVITITVAFPDAKNWWRNFTGDGGPMSLELDGANREGHAVAGRDAKGRVLVTVRLND
ncbi:hypothetical protein [Streptomyces sp. NPDC001401]|uniref:hypothetical protein n=1 Tax=Streptomyces sp. NPDC001401 TaxID=3364570 RepID=UPI003686439D